MEVMETGGGKGVERGEKREGDRREKRGSEGGKKDRV